MTPKDREEYVRSRWERLTAEAWTNKYTHDGGFTIAIEPSCEDGSIGIGTVAHIESGCEEGAWIDAYAFTKEREEQIRQVEEEINLLDCMAPLITKHDIDIWADIDAEPDDATIDDCATIAIDAAKFQCQIQRILAREQAALAELKKGMRQ